MNIHEIKRALPVLRKHKIVPLLWGAQGVGKTQVVKQYAIENNLGFVALYPATQEPGDIVGLLEKTPDGQASKHLRPEWFPTEGEGVVFIDECLTGETMIVTDKGTKSIKEIYCEVQDEKEIFVKSFNTETKTFEFKKVTYAWNKGKKPVIGVQLNNGKIVTCTENHPFLTDKGYVQAKDLVQGTKIVAYVESKEKTATPALNKEQLSVVYGAILGDAAVVSTKANKSKHLSFIHGEKQEEYLKYKAWIFNAKPSRVEKNGYAQKPAYRFFTRRIADLYGKSKSQLMREALDNLNPIVMAIWLQDDGSIGNNTYTLHTEGWKSEDIDYAIVKLNERGYKCRLQVVRKRDGKSYNVIYVTAEGTRKFSADVAQYVHPSMRYKLLQCDRNVEFKTINNKFLDFGYFVFDSFTEPYLYKTKGNRRYVYDIEVEDNHNFVVATRRKNNGVVVHNCNRSHPDLINAMFSFITNGTIHTHKLPPGWTIVAAANYQSNMFNVTDTSDAAWMSRFCHIDFQPSVEEFVLYLEEKEAFSVASFLRNHPEMSHVKHKERVNTAMITPDHRSWLEMIAKLEGESSIDDLRYELYSGIVGPTAAAAFLTDKQKQNERISGKQILSQYSKVRERVIEASNPKSTRFDMLNSAVEEILLQVVKKDLTKKQMDNFKEFILDVPLEMGLKVINKLHEITWKQKNDILNNPEFVKLFTKKKLKKEKKND